jgi:isochorismate pyruvate lyase
MTISDHPRRTAADCTTMDEVRAEIDRLDRLLVRLLAERQTYIEAAARIKPDRATVRDEWRINDVLAKVRARAEREGLDWAIAEPVWRTLIERCIAHEFVVYDALREGEAACPDKMADTPRAVRR